jgi:hypothetical protein
MPALEGRRPSFLLEMCTLVALPYAIVLMACGVFGELCIRMPSDHFGHGFFLWVFGAAAAASGGMFFFAVNAKPTWKHFGSFGLI